MDMNPSGHMKRIYMNKVIEIIGEHSTSKIKVSWSHIKIEITSIYINKIIFIIFVKHNLV